MKTTIINLALLLSSAVLLNYASAQSVWVTSEDLLSTKSTEEFYQFNEEFNVQITKPLSNSRQPHLQNVYEISCNCDVVDLFVATHKLPGIKGITYGPTYETLAEPDDYALYTDYTNNNNSAWHLDLIWAQSAWDVTHGTEAVAISDQNIFANHEDVIGNLQYYDATNTSSQGHGTAVYTAAVGNTNNGTGLSSIGYDTEGAFYRMNYNEVLAAAYAGYRVINMSWTSGCDHNQYVEDALHEAYNEGLFLIASAGNGSTCGGPTELVYPAAYDIVFAVSSVDHNDSHDNPNGSSSHQHNSSVDLLAPGYNVPITAAPGWVLFGSGTSYAAPIVTGTVGLILSAYPGITNPDIKSLLQTTATNVDAQNPNYIGMIGAGRLNAGLAVKTALANYYWSQTTTPIEPNTDPILDIDNDILSDGNNGHGNDEGGFDPSNPGQGNDGNNGNNGNGTPNTEGDFEAAAPKFVAISNGIYDMSGKKVELQYASNGMYLIVENGIVIRKIWK